MADPKPEENGGFSKPNELVMIDSDPPKPPKRNKYVFACAMLASMTSVLLGYDIGVMSEAPIYIKKDLKCTDVQIEILIVIMNLCSLVGSVAAGRMSDWIGRRYTIAFAGALFFVGAILTAFATNYAFLMVGRFVAGIGVGYAHMIPPVYTTEVSPASARGFLTSFPEVCINVAIPSICLVVVVLGMPESPHWLVMQGRLGDARIVLDKTSNSLEESKLRLADIKEVIGVPKDCNDDIVQVPKHKHSKDVWKELLVHPTPTVRHILIAAIGIHFFQQASGIDAIVLYSPRIFEMAGIVKETPQLLTTMAAGFVKTISVLVATFLLDRVGRRPLLLSSVAGMILSLIGLGIGLTVIGHFDYKIKWAIILSFAMILSYVAFFSIGMGPITGVYSSEIFPLRLRAQGYSIGVVVNRVVSGVISMTFLFLSIEITLGGAFFLFAGVATVAFVFFYTLFPETQGKNLEEVEHLFGTFFRWRSRSAELKRKKEAEMRTNKAQT